jgi:hypothetical protein
VPFNPADPANLISILLLSFSSLVVGDWRRPNPPLEHIPSLHLAAVIAAAALQASIVTKHGRRLVNFACACLFCVMVIHAPVLSWLE